MSATLHRQAAELFKAALEVPAAQRERFLSERSADTPALRAEVDALLRADSDSERFLKNPPAMLDALRSADADELVGRSLGDYRILRRIASGGMGTVYEALQEALGRTVALKLVRGGLSSPAATRRFEYEGRVLARLQHPGIAQIYEAGTHSLSGIRVPFFAMEYVPNARTLLQYAEAASLPLRRRVELFAEVCAAVQYGHQRGVIHRDLKPSNILVGQVAAAGPGAPPSPTIKVIDFGVARCVDDDSALTSLHTSAGMMIGTLQYMSPEQCSGDLRDIDVRSDVYSLGVVLYELLSGRLPYDVAGRGLVEATRIIREYPIPRLSAIQRATRGDLDTIVSKALEKDRTRRYQSAGELARDVEHYLLGEPIDARRDSGWYVLRKTLKRYRGTAAVVATFVLLVTASAVSLSVLYGRQGVLLKDVARERDRALVAGQIAEQRRQKAEYESYLANVAAADGALTANDGGAALARLDEAPAALRNWEWRFLRRAADPSIATFHGLESHHIRHVGFSPNGRFLAGVSHRPGLQSQLDVWDWISGASVLKERIGDDTKMSFYVTPYRFSRNDSQLLVCPGDGSIVRYELEHGESVGRHSIGGMLPGAWLGIIAPPVFVSARPVESHSIVRFWNEEDAALRGEFEATNWFNASDIAPDRRSFAIGRDDGVVHLCAIAPDAKPVQFKAHSGSIHGLTFSSDGRLLATSSEDGLIGIWRLPKDDASGTVESVTSFRGSEQRVGSVAFSPDGLKLAAASADKSLRVWNIADGALLHLLRGHAGGLCAVAFHPDGTHLATGSYDASLKLWDLERPSETIVRRGLPGYVGSIVFDADGSRLLAGTTGGAVILDVASGRTLQAVGDTPDFGGWAFFDADGTHAIIGHNDGTVRVRELAISRETRRIVVEPSGAVRIALNAAGTQLACAAELTGVVTLRDPASGSELGRLEHGNGTPRALAYSPDGLCLATGLSTGEASLSDIRSRRPLWTTREHTAAVLSIAFTRDGSRIATTSDDGTINLCDARTGKVQRTLRPQLGDVWCVAFSPDGSRLAAGGRDRTARIFDSATGHEVLSLRGPTGTIMSIAWSPDGRRIAAGTWTREVFIWDDGLGFRSRR